MAHLDTSNKIINHIQLTLKSEVRDILGQKIAEKAAKYLNIDTAKIKSSKIFSVLYQLEDKQLSGFATECLKDAVINDLYINDFYENNLYKSYILVAKKPGVTDDEGISAQKSLSDFLNVDLDTKTQHIFSKQLYLIENQLTKQELQSIAQELLANKLIHHFEYGDATSIQDYTPKVNIVTDNRTELIDLDLTDDDLVKLSTDKLLALNLEEMKAIQQYYQEESTQNQRQKANISLQPTDCELEILGQTWSEHCKHKEFNAIIHYKDLDTEKTKYIDSLFQTYIKGATDKVAASLKTKSNNWLIKVFSDNAGVVRINEDSVFIWKVETHNSPSAIDPYGGAITGILGNNRDPLATGVGGGKLLFNTNVLCFGSPFYDKPLIGSQLHPKRILEGVTKGIEDGGNKSGIPTVNGSVIFDERYSGKPLVYCGTGAVMPYKIKGKASWEKPISAGDHIIMAGGRVGKDGIHGATFSSIELDENAPASAVQIGSPITQKLLSDFLVIACNKGWIKCSTDNGAGGLSSSVGELAIISGGAVVHLEKVPLKYSGLQPWEIFVSESQERMTLVIEPEYLETVFSFAKKMEVEVTDIGNFTDTGFLDIQYDDQKVAYLSMSFLHDGTPKKEMFAEWQQPELTKAVLPTNLNYNDILLRLMSSLNICSRENIIRQYDHEVKGKTIVKPLMGKKGKSPQDAAVMRYNFKTYEGVAISNGIIPHYGDINAYEMSAGAFDEAVRQIISVGGSLPNLSENDGIFWSVNDNFCVPDSVYHPQNNPDGKLKCAKLVQMCEALYDMAVYFDIPLTSGKDSMKNDFKAGNQKISVPPTILYSMTAKITDVRKVVTSDFKVAGDLIYQLGKTYNELACSEFYRLFDEQGIELPKVRKEAAKSLYIKIMTANQQGLIQSSHDLSDGGLAVALVESTFNDLGAMISLDQLGELSLNALLFAESHSRFVVSIQPKDQIAFEQLFGKDAFYLGTVTKEKTLSISHQKQSIINLTVDQLLEAWDSGLALIA